MAVNDYIDINLDDIPVQFDYTIDGIDFTFYLYYNEVNDSYYIDLFDENGVQIVNGEKLIYGYPLFGSINDPRLPLINIVPMDEQGNETEVSKLNFTNTVQLFIKDTDDDDIDANTGNSSDEGDDDTVSDNTAHADINDYGTDKSVGDE